MSLTFILSFRFLHILMISSGVFNAKLDGGHVYLIDFVTLDHMAAIKGTYTE